MEKAGFKTSSDSKISCICDNRYDFFFQVTAETKATAVGIFYSAQTWESPPKML
jgi:hypothetical protein